MQYYDCINDACFFQLFVVIISFFDFLVFPRITLDLIEIPDVCCIANNLKILCRPDLREGTGEEAQDCVSAAKVFKGSVIPPDF